MNQTSVVAHTLESTATEAPSILIKCSVLKRTEYSTLFSLLCMFLVLVVF